MIGKTISHYKIIEKLGEGGMGIVYIAEDSKLKRNVALKFLPPELTRDAEAKERFVHEARAASALQHTNICTIHAIDETEDGQLFICMDHYKGETLKKKIEQRPLKLDDAINIATQIAQGLSKAHEAGIVHRDIKPANIIITEDDEVKILDFGLVKLTGFTKLTKPGSTLGTTYYMSPEQMRGEKVDHRTDIWALGVVLYEMITGQLPFKGEYEQAVSYAIMNDEPESITALRSGMPIALDGIISKALAKEPKQRYQHIDEIPVDLSNIETRPSGSSKISRRADSGSLIQQPAAKQTRIPWRIVVPLLVAAVAISSIATWLLKPQPEPEPVSRFIHFPLTGETLVRNSLAISFDGNKIVYGATTAGVTKLYLRKIDQLEATPIDNTEGAFGPFFSPDSRKLCFFADKKLKKVLIDGGPAQTLCDDLTIYLSGTWGDDGNIIFVGAGLGLLRVSAAGGTPEVILAPDSGKISSYYRYPEMLPGSKTVLYTAWEGDNEANIYVLSLETRKSKLLIKGGTRPLYSLTDHILFGRRGSYWAVPFDVKQLKITGKKVPVREGVVISSYGDAGFRVSTNGDLVYIPDVDTGGERTLVLVDRSGVETSLTAIKGTYFNPCFSPDGKRVAIIIDEGKGICNIWIHDVARGTPTPLTSRGCDINSQNSWSPDGTKITFTSGRSGVRNLYWKRADNIGGAELLSPIENMQWGGSWSDDGTFTFHEDPSTAGRNIWVCTTRDSIPTPFLNTENNDFGAAISPDGKWITYTSDRTGQDEIYIIPYPGPGGEEPVSTQGGGRALWAPDGRELFYREGDKMMFVTVKTQPSLKLGMPEPLFEKPYLSNNWSPQYDIHPDGDRFVMIKENELTNSQINIVLNWFELLKEKMATAE
jgi:serine/threonine protein kinase/Tol biopolymer transport system component